MITQTLPKKTTIYNPFEYPVAEPITRPEDVSEARAWSGEIDEETLADELAEPCPLPPSKLPEIDPDLFEQVFCWFIS
jgi:hypothetical protein